MSLIFRLLWIFLTQIRGRRAADLFDTQYTRSRALPNDLDLNLHVNNGRLMTYVDIGRINWLYKNGALQYAYKKRCIPVVGDVSARFLRPLKVFDRFTIETRLLGWGAKWAYFEHRVIKENGQIALILADRGMFWSGKKGAMPVQEVLSGISQSATTTPELPAWVRTWALSLDQAREELAASIVIGGGKPSNSTITDRPDGQEAMPLPMTENLQASLGS